MNETGSGPPFPTLPLPWTGRECPHAVLDILRGCNIRCPDCYNARPPAVKSTARALAELDTLLGLRRLQAVTLSGGEPLLHPDLPEIVRGARARGLKVAILTNGVLLDAERAACLRRAGATSLLFHIQRNQVRPDLPAAAPDADWTALRRDKAALAAGAGLAAGWAHVAEPESLSELTRILEELADSPHAEFLLITARTDFARYAPVRGDLAIGIRTLMPDGRSAPAAALTCDIFERFMDRRGLRPFGHIPAALTPGRRRWLTYLFGALRGTPRPRLLSVTPSRSDRFFMRLSRALTGRRTFLYRAGPVRFRLQLLCNGLTGGTPPSAVLPFLAASLHPFRRLSEKHVVFQEGPSALPDGRLDICRDCPDATLVNGRLVPLCLSDHLEEPCRPASAS